MSDEWDVSDAEFDSLLDEWEAVDCAAAEYLAERVSGLRDRLADEDAGWVGRLVETISPSEEPEEREIEAVSAVMALQHADWLGLALGVVRRGPGAVLDPGRVQADIDRLGDVDGGSGPRRPPGRARDGPVHLTPLWQNLGVLDEHATHRARRVGITKGSAPHLEPVMRHSTANGYYKAACPPSLSFG
jgi:hypothetical protein